MADDGLSAATPEELAHAQQAGEVAGMFFTFAARDTETTWRPATTLYRNPDQLDRLLAEFATRLGAVPPRVTASLLYQGFAARLLSPPLTAVLRAGCLPDIHSLEWSIPAGQALALTATPAAGLTGDRQRLLDRLIANAYPQHLDPLATALRERVSVAPGLLRGNAAASLFSGLRLLAQPVWRRLGERVLRHPELADTITMTPHGYTRRSCCLYYRVVPGGLCGDCPLSKHR